MRRTRSALAVLVALGLAAPAGAADDLAAATNAENFARVLTLMEDTAQAVRKRDRLDTNYQLERDGRISQDEFRYFLLEEMRRPGSPAHAPLARIGLSAEVLDEARLFKFVGDQAKGAFGPWVRSDGTVDERTFPGFLAASLAAPLPPTVAALFPEGLLVALPKPGKGRLETFFAGLDRTVIIRKSILDQAQIGRPATFTWSRFGGADQTRMAGSRRQIFEVVGAFGLEPERLFRIFRPSEGLHVSVQPTFAVELDYASNQPDALGQVVHRGALQTVFYRPDSLRRPALALDLVADYRTDVDYDADVYQGTLQLSPIWFGGAIGEWHGLGLGADATWAPYAGVRYSHVADDGGLAALLTRDDYANLFARLSGALRFGRRLVITPELQYEYETLGEGESHWLWSVSARLALDEKDRVSIEMSHERGERFPEFLERELTKLGLGLKF